MIELTAIQFVLWSFVAILIGYVFGRAVDWFKIADMNQEINRLSEKCLYQDIEIKSLEKK